MICDPRVWKFSINIFIFFFLFWGDECWNKVEDNFRYNFFQLQRAGAETKEEKN